MSEAQDANGASSHAMSPFLCGVCEGFYGKPWTSEQRQELFVRMNRMGMTTYLYAPKDDYKHRLYWRELYSEEEGKDLQELITSAKANNVTFVYALSPGLDITYSDEDDKKDLKCKLDQIAGFGCEAFSLLFDDIEPEMCEEDEKCFKTVAHAQCVLTNDAYNHLKQPHTFLFCPTEYCTSRASPELAKSDYLKTLGKELHKGIDIMWTGPKVVSRKITLTGIQDLIKHIKRPPVIWDNIHANDYDQTRVFLGPYDGRSQQLRMLLRGVLTNPNCEFETNFIAMHTLAQWSKNHCETYPEKHNSSRNSAEMETDRISVPIYNPKTALEYAVSDWLPEFYRRRCSSSKRCSTKLAQSDSSTTGMEVDEKDTNPPLQPKKDMLRKSKKRGGDVGKVQYIKSTSAKKKDKRKMEELDKLTTNDLLLICDLFYLPYEYGPRGVHLLKTAHWLISNVDRLSGSQGMADHKPPVREWYESAMHFHDCHKDLCQVVDKFVNITNRDLLYELYNYVSDMRSCMSLVNGYIKWHGMGKPDKEPFRRSEQEPWVHRSGIYSEFRRLLPIEGQNDMFPAAGKLSSGNRVFTIRPYYPEDKVELYNVCLRSCDDGLDGTDIFPDHPELVPDDWIGCLIEHFPQHTYVLSDDGGTCGYVTAAPDIQAYRQLLHHSWLPRMKEKYKKSDKKSTATNSKLDGEDILSPAEVIIKAFHQDLPPLPEILTGTYPAYLQIQLLGRRVEGLSTPSQLFDACIKGLKALGVSGVHTVLHSNQLTSIGLRFKLGFDEISTSKKDLGDFLLLGKAI